MENNRQVPDIVVGRLPIYLRALTFLKADNREITSSQELGDRLGISSAQIRKDLSHFGEFGKQGTGYEIRYLENNLKEILHVNRMWDVVLVGTGDLGHRHRGGRGHGRRREGRAQTDLRGVGEGLEVARVAANTRTPVAGRARACRARSRHSGRSPDEKQSVADAPGRFAQITVAAHGRRRHRFEAVRAV